MKIYTKTGDQGTTGLVNGTRLSKADERIQLYGEVDELNSFIGWAAVPLEKTESDLYQFLQKIQSALFDLGSNLACEQGAREKFKLPQIQPELILELEKSMDELSEKITPLKTFILPGGNESAARFHLCRTVARRVERAHVAFSQQTEIEPLWIQFLNRLSDYFFVLSRYLNREGVEIPWKPYA